MSIFGKINPSLFKDIEKSTLRWIEVRKYRIPISVFVVAILWTLSAVPYFNLVLNSYLVILASAVVVPSILAVNVRLLFVMALALFAVTFFTWFIDRDISERLAEYIFIILFSGVLRTLISNDEGDKINKFVSDEINKDNKQRR